MPTSIASQILTNWSLKAEADLKAQGVPMEDIQLFLVVSYLIGRFTTETTKAVMLKSLSEAVKEIQ